MSAFWGWFIGILTVGSIGGCIWLCLANSRVENPESTTGHVWDEDLEEYNNPLPLWWLMLFYGSIVFGIGYFILYPGIGFFNGTLGWSQASAYDAEVAAAEARYGDVYAPFAGRDLAELVTDERALELGRRLYAANCTTCHGSDARGAKGFPNLADGDWLYGGAPEQVKYSILNGRNGIMPALGTALGEQGVTEVMEHLKTLRGADADATLAQAGATRFATLCAACHGADGTGMHALGAPNLTDDIWLHGGDDQTIASTINEGRNNRMPAQADLLGENRVHVLAAYVLSLSKGGDGMSSRNGGGTLSNTGGKAAH